MKGVVRPRYSGAPSVPGHCDVGAGVMGWRGFLGFVHADPLTDRNAYLTFPYVACSLTQANSAHSISFGPKTSLLQRLLVPDHFHVCFRSKQRSFRPVSGGKASLLSKTCNTY